MYYITKRDSETGKKFQVIADKIKEVRSYQNNLSKELGFKQWRDGYWDYMGGFSALIFDESPDQKIYKKVNGDEWMPRKNTKLGKEINQKLIDCPKISILELNQCIGFDESCFKTIGFAWSNPDYFGFITDAKWELSVPNDCEEVTHSKYNILFDRKSK